MPDSDEILHTRLDTMRNDYVVTLEDKINKIKDIWISARFGEVKSANIQDLIEILEELQEAGLTFGFSNIANAAHYLAQFLIFLSRKNYSLGNEHREQIEQLLELLELAIASKDAASVYKGFHRWEPSTLISREKDKQRLVFLFGDKNRFLKQVIKYLRENRYQAIWLDPIAELPSNLTHTTPSAVIINDIYPEAPSSATKSILDIKNKFHTDIPIIFISPRVDLNARLQATRAGCAFYFCLPVNLNLLLGTLDQIITGAPREPYRVMIIDNDEVLSEFYAFVLEQQGMAVTTVNHPLQAMEVIDESKPELILMDMHMPECSGLELATIIRQQDNLAGVSIAFLTSGMDFEQKLTAINIGSDDFLSKPADPEHLVLSVSARVRRARSLSNMSHKLFSTLRELENQQFAINQHAIVSICNINGDIIHVNDQFCEISGYNYNELVGNNHRILASGQHDKDFFTQMWQDISCGKVWQGEICNSKKNGELYWLKSTIVPFLDEKKRPYQYVAINSDITYRYLAEQNLLKARDEAVTENRAKSDFLSNISHELRTPLNAILGFSQLLQSSPIHALSETQFQYTDEIYHAGKHLLNLINDVLDLSRIEAGELKVNMMTVPLLSFLDECCSLIAPLAEERKISVVKKYGDDDDIDLYADPLRLKQIMVNLLSNAIKYNEEHGVIELNGWSENDKIQIEIIDTGTGIAEADMGNLFQPFSRLAMHSNEEGAGIGLALSKRLVELMDGEINVESRLGQGSRFWITLNPDCQNGHSSDKEVDSPLLVDSSKVAGPPASILYIEDNQANFSLVKEILLQRPNIDLLHATTAETGIDIAKTHRPDIILMDLQLPGMDGYAGLEALRCDEVHKNTPVIAISAYANREDIQRALQLGFEEYITKPIDIASFLSTIDSLAERLNT
jgi:PAS domain S-box-containing protein